jgi:hypothetical protein
MIEWETYHLEEQPNATIGAGTSTNKERGRKNTISCIDEVPLLVGYKVNNKGRYAMVKQLHYGYNPLPAVPGAPPAPGIPTPIPLVVQ